MTLVPKVQMSPGGPAFSALVQGYWRMAQWDMNPQQRLSFIKAHVEMGITTVDHAHIYGNPSIYGNPPCESLFGEALKLDPALRDQLQIISKCGIPAVALSWEDRRVAHYNNSRESILSSVDTSLSRLGVEYLDALLIHRHDFLMDAEEVAETFGILKESGKVNYFGVSNFPPSQISLLQSHLDMPLMTNQVEINPFNFSVAEDGTLDIMQQYQMRPMAWSCMAGGRIFNEQSRQADRLRQTLTELMEELDAASIDQVVYAWVMRLPSKPLPILGSGNMKRVRRAIDSLKLSLNHEQWYRVWSASKGHKVP
ncbi:aldo/keto reductase [bacterium]|nr:aldo/keto reductase [bacterium]